MSPYARGLLKVAVGLLVCLAVALLLPDMRAAAGGSRKVLISALVGPMITIGGLFEFLLGAPTTEWMERWPTLPVWGQWVIAAVSVVVFTALVLGTVLLAR